MELLRAMSRSRLVVPLLAVFGLALPGEPAAAAMKQLEPNSVWASFSYEPAVGQWTEDTFVTGPSRFPLSDVEPLVETDGVDTRIQLPNFIDLLPRKTINLKLFYYNLSKDDAEAISIDVVGFDANSSVSNGAMKKRIVLSDGLDEPDYVHFYWELVPNPDYERIFVGGDPGRDINPGNLFAMEIHTVSLPVPAALPLFLSAAMGIGAVGWRRRGAGA